MSPGLFAAHRRRFGRRARQPGRWALLGLLCAIGVAPSSTQAVDLAAPAPAEAIATDAEDRENAARQVALRAAVADYEAGSLPEAQAEFETLARRGVPAAMHDLAVMHLRGELPGADPQQARQWFEQAAERGFVTSQFALGELFESGRLGRPDLAAALAWFQRAARSGSVDAQVAAGTAFFIGRGTPRDYAEAARWYMLAATAGDVGAQYILASLYEHGDGVAIDLNLAREWYAAAARQGDPAAPDKVRELDARLAAEAAAASEATAATR